MKYLAIAFFLIALVTVSNEAQATGCPNPGLCPAWPGEDDDPDPFPPDPPPTDPYPGDVPELPNRPGNGNCGSVVRDPYQCAIVGLFNPNDPSCDLIPAPCP